jgi:hypothetical protein
MPCKQHITPLNPIRKKRAVPYLKRENHLVPPKLLLYRVVFLSFMKWVGDMAEL